MTYYAGLDVSLKETKVCVLAPGGVSVARGSVATEPAAISAWLAAQAPRVEVAVLETGGMSSWLASGLVGHGVRAVIVDARLAKKALSGRANKSDANDAEGLAWLALTGWYRRVAVKSEEFWGQNSGDSVLISNSGLEFRGHGRNRVGSLSEAKMWRSEICL